MLWAVFFESKAIFWIKDTNRSVCVLDNEIREEVLTVSVRVFINERKE